MFQCMKNTSSTANCLTFCEGLLVNSFIKTKVENEFGPFFKRLISQYNSFHQPIWLPPLLKSMMNIFTEKLNYFTLQNFNGKTNFIWSESSLIPQLLIELPRTEQLSLLIMCLLLEEQWDFSLDSLSSVL